MASIRKKLAAISLAAAALLQCSLLSGAAEAAQEAAGSEDSSVGITEEIDTNDTPNKIIPYSSGEAYCKGDVTGDGKVELNDCFLVMRYNAKLISFTQKQQSAADVTGDGRVSLADATIIQRYILGLDNSLSGGTSPSDPSDDPVQIPSNGFGDNATEDTSITVSSTSYTVPAGKTLYVTASSGVTWGSTNDSYATVDQNGLILAKKPGTVKIIALNGNKKRTINIRIVEAEPIRTAYCSPNSAATGQQVKLIATTDQSFNAVRFEVDVNGKKTTVNATSKTADNAHGIYTWTATMTASAAGTFDVKAYAQKGSSWSSCPNGETTMFVSANKSTTTPSLNTLRASDDVIRLISQYEGGLEEAEFDPLAYGNVMNYGYGVVIQAGDMFYNRAAMSEYFADLVNQINENIYSSYVNEFLQSNKIKYNQQQFDSLVCFTYNLGVYSLQNASLKSVLLNCYEPSAGSSSNSSTATVRVDGYLNLRSGAGTNYTVIDKLYNGDTVTVLDSKKVNEVWLKVKTPNGTVGYCSSDYLIMGGSAGNSGTRNFNYINQYNLRTELMAWHHAGGNCYYGLLYRRIDELELFFYGDYTQDGYTNKHGWEYPSCIS